MTHMSVEACLTFPYGKTASARYQKNAKVKKVSFRNLCSLPGAPLTYFNDGGGGGVVRDLFRSEILAQSDFFGMLPAVSSFYEH